MKIIILQGPPASGKSTWAKEFITSEQNANKDWVIVSRDAIREARGEYWIPKQEDYISDIEHTAVASAVKHKLNVIIDATNLNPKVIAKWTAFASDECEVEIKEFYIPFAEAVERDIRRGEQGGHSIGKKEIEKFYRKYYRERLEDESRQTVDHPRIPIQANLPSAYICDLDGTIAWMQDRSPYDRTKVSSDKVDPRLAQMLSGLMKNGDYILFVSAREGDQKCYSDTLEWLKSNLAFYQSQNGEMMFSLLMRKKGDYRPDEIIKEEIYRDSIEGKYDIVCVFDDRDKVVKMWRNIGMLCCQVNDGDF